jgi:hypothetical protein
VNILISISILFSLVHNSNVGPAVNDLLSSPDEVHVLFETYDRETNEKGINERLDAFAEFLKNNATFSAYIISYAGRRSCRGEALQRAKTAKAYLMRKGKIERRRIKVIDGGYRESWTVQLWNAPTNAKGTPPISETINKGVQIIKCNH